MLNQRIRRLLVRALPVLLPVAIVGYLLGGSVSHSNPSSSPTPVARVLADSDTVVLEYPADYGWSESTHAQAIPGLALTRMFAIEPRGQESKVGLLAGELTRADPLSPLPAALFSSKTGLDPAAQVVSLLDTQAYHYVQSGSPKAGGESLVVYAVPYTTSPTVAIVCYAPTGSKYSGYLRTCEQIAAQLTLQGGAQAQVSLTPDAGYARGVHKVMQQLEGLRTEARATLHQGGAQGSFAGKASALADGFDDAQRTLVTLQPPSTIGALHSALSEALAIAADAYGQLATAAAEREPNAFSSARSRVYSAEGDVDSALRGLALVGYG